MNGKNVVISLIVTLFIALIMGVIGFVIYINRNAIHDSLNGAKLYTEAEMKEACDKALADQQDTLNKYVSEINAYKSEIDSLKSTILDRQNKIDSLESDIQSKKNKIDSLNVDNANLQSQIDSKNAEINRLNDEIDSINTDHTNEITELNNQISELQCQIVTNNNTINSLNAEIVVKDNEINRLKSLAGNSENTIATLNEKISTLEASVSRYKELLGASVTESSVIATFEMNNAVYDVKIVPKDSTIDIVNPVDTEYLKFKGWCVKDTTTHVDMATYTINQDTTFVADVENYHQVKVMDGSNVLKTSYVLSGTCMDMSDINTNTDSHRRFRGYSLNGYSIVDPATVSITSNLTFYALFTDLNFVTFIDTIDNSTISIKEVERGNVLLTLPDTPARLGYDFDGWATTQGNANTIINFNDYPISSDITVYTIWTAVYDLSYKVNDTIISNRQVRSGTMATMVPVDTTRYLIFNGWTLDGSTIVDPTTIAITSNTTFIASVVNKFDLTIAGIDESPRLLSSLEDIVYPNAQISAIKIITHYTINGDSRYDDGTIMSADYTAPYGQSVVLVPVYEYLVNENYVISDIVSMYLSTDNFMHVSYRGNIPNGYTDSDVLLEIMKHTTSVSFTYNMVLCSAYFGTTEDVIESFDVTINVPVGSAHGYEGHVVVRNKNAVLGRVVESALTVRFNYSENFGSCRLTLIEESTILSVSGTDPVAIKHSFENGRNIFRCYFENITMHLQLD